MNTNSHDNTKKSTTATILAIIFAALFLGAVGFIVMDKIILAGSDSSSSSSVGHKHNQEIDNEDDGSGAISEIVDSEESKASFKPHYITEGRSAEYKDKYIINNYQGANSRYCTMYQPPYTANPGDKISDVEEPDNMHFSVDLSKAVDYYEGYNNAPTKKVKEEIVFDSPVRMVMAGGMGQGLGDEVIVFIMADGAVQYIPVWRSASEGKILLRKVEGVEDIIAATENWVSTFSKNDDGTYSPTVGGGVDIILHQMDGSYYRLHDFVGDSEDFKQ